MSLSAVLRSFGSRPGYTVMRGIARFEGVRSVIARARGLVLGKQTDVFLRQAEERVSESPFAGLDREEFVRRLICDGVAHGLALPQHAVCSIRDWATSQPCYADRNAAHGFALQSHGRAQVALGKPILLAQYFNTQSECPPVAELIRDPVLNWIACRYLQSVPTFLGSNLWWTFPVAALESDRDLHAHLFHRDVDDFRFFKFFFYLTDVSAGEGAHVCVTASHRAPPTLQRGDKWKIRRYSDAEIAASYPEAQITEVCGPAGTGFAENTLCIHKGSTPKTEARLLLQLQFGLFDYGAMHDRRAASDLKVIA